MIDAPIAQLVALGPVPPGGGWNKPYSRAYAMRASGRDDLPPAPEPSLDEMITRAAKRITAIERLMARNELKAREYEAEYLAQKREMVDGYTEAAARLKAPLADAEATLLELLQRLPEGRRKYRHGRCLFGVTPARESVEITDEDAALTEVHSLGDEKAALLIRTKESINKKELAEFIKRGDAPGFEHIKLRLGSDSLRRTYPRG